MLQFHTSRRLRAVRMANVNDQLPESVEDRVIRVYTRRVNVAFAHTDHTSLLRDPDEFLDRSDVLAEMAYSLVGVDYVECRILEGQAIHVSFQKSHVRNILFLGSFSRLVQDGVGKIEARCLALWHKLGQVQGEGSRT